MPPASTTCKFCRRVFKHAIALKIHITKKHKSGVSTETSSPPPNKTPRPNPVAATKRVETESEVSNIGGKLSPKKIEQQNSGIETEKEIIKPWRNHFTYSSSSSTTVYTLPAYPEVPEPIGTLVICEYCQEKFYDKVYLNWHVKHEHQNSYVFDDEDEEDDFENAGTRAKLPRDVKPDLRTLHKYRNRQPPKIFECYKCAKTFGNKLLLKRHMQLKQCDIIIQNETIVCCGLCDVEFVGIQNLVLHQKQDHNINPKALSASPNKNLALPESPKPKRRVMKRVNKMGRNKKRKRRGSRIRVTVDVHQDDDDEDDDASSDKSDSVNYTCLFCPRKLKSDSGLLSHIQTAHQNISDSIQCPYCEFMSDCAEELYRHARTHDELRPYPCTMCTKRFVTKANLKSHMNSHEDKDKVHQCRICSKSYCYFSSLKRHVMASHGQKLKT